jgi:uncharacterized membrane protein YidH (DUF202 family)
MSTPKEKVSFVEGRTSLILISLAISFLVGAISFAPFVILLATLDPLHLHLPRIFELIIVFTFFAMVILVIIFCFKKAYGYLKGEGLSWWPYTKRNR